MLMKITAIDTIIDRNNSQQVNLIQQRELLAQRLLGEHYDGVYNFFCDVLEDKSAYKILRARRCQVLFELFISIIMLHEDIDITGVFISSNALENYMDTLCATSVSVLIVDDVLIHGRGMKRIYEKIDPAYSRNNVLIMVYCRALSATCVDEVLDKRFHKNYLPAFDYTWRSISCCLVDLIVSSAIPYESFAGSLENLYSVDGFTTDENFDVIKNLNSEQESTYIVFEKKQLPSFFQRIGYDACLRVYASRALNTTSYVPYVFVKNIISDISQLFDFLNSHLDHDRFGHIIDLLSVNDKELAVYQMRLFSAFVNRLYGVYLQKNYGILDRAQPNCINMELCFDHEIAQELLNMQYEDISKLLVECPPYITGLVLDDSELDKRFLIYDKDNDTTKNLYRYLSMYYYIIGQYDDESAKNNIAQKSGLSMGYFYENIDHSLLHTMTAAQLKCWDSGQASGVMKMDENGTIALYGMAGEQNFRFIIQENKDFFRKLAIQYSLSFIDAKKNWNDESVYEQLYSYNETIIANEESSSTGMSEFLKKNINLLHDFLDNNLSSLAEWFIPQIL